MSLREVGGINSIIIIIVTVLFWNCIVTMTIFFFYFSLAIICLLFSEYYQFITITSIHRYSILLNHD